MDPTCIKHMFWVLGVLAAVFVLFSQSWVLLSCCRILHCGFRVADRPPVVTCEFAAQCWLRFSFCKGILSNDTLNVLCLVESWHIKVFGKIKSFSDVIQFHINFYITWWNKIQTSFYYGGSTVNTANEICEKLLCVFLLHGWGCVR